MSDQLQAPFDLPAAKEKPVPT